jgi:hypothetical protein
MILNGVTLPDPNSFSEDPVVFGSYVQTMSGGTRRAIRAKKYIWKLGWGNLTESQFSSINAIYNLNTTVSFVNNDISPTISATVHLDLSSRTYLSGTGKYLSAVELTLTEV